MVQYSDCGDPASILRPRSTSSQHTPPTLNKTLNSKPSLSDSICLLRDSAAADTFTQHSLDTASRHSQAASEADGKPVLRMLQVAPSPTASLQNPARLPRSSLFPALSTGDLARSPRERLNALLGTANSTSATAVLQTTPPDPNTALSSPGSQFLNQSHSASPTPPQTSTLFSMTGSAAPSAADVAKPEVVARNASMDSVSSTGLSTTSASRPSTNTIASNQSFQDTTLHSAPDTAALIAEAGSPEAAIEKLLKDRQATAARSEQLWRLVEKQRTMILDLNKDLERAFKDKERYKKKLKEQAASQPARGSKDVVEGVKDASHIRQLHHPDSPTCIAEESFGKSLTRLIDVTSLSSPQSMLEAATIIVVEDSTAERTDDLSSATAQAEPLPSTMIKSLSTPSWRPSEKFEHVIHSPGGSTSQQDGIPLSSSAAVKNNSLSNSEKTRKHAPAPLDLSKTPQIHPALHRAQHEREAETDYADQIQPEKFPTFERGRQRTREEDDYQRETFAREEERRSRSGKENKSKSKSSSSRKSKYDAKADTNGVAEGLAKSAEQPEPAAAADYSQQIGLPTSTLASLTIGPTAAGLNMVAAETGQPQPTSLAPRSPGLPMSPRPENRPLNSPVPRMFSKTMASPVPITPRSYVANLPLSPRAPRHPIPLPPNTPLAAISPHLARAEGYGQQLSQQASLVERLQPSYAAFRLEEQSSRASTDAAFPERVHTGLMSEHYPGLLLPPSALPYVDVKVNSSRLRPSRHSIQVPKHTEENPILTLAVNYRSDGKQLWRVEKTLVDLPLLDQSIKLVSDFSGKLPDRNLFTGHSPLKVDARRAALNEYFGDLLTCPVDENAALTICQFFSKDVISPESDHALVLSGADSENVMATKHATKPKMEGYLAKKGKQFGGWKARYFVLDGPDLQYYEAPAGQHLGYIKLQNAQIGRQNAAQTDDDAEFRHAFVILEARWKDASSIIRHVLCAESDEERDGWVEALMQYVDSHDNQVPSPKELGTAKSGGFTVRTSSDSGKKTLKPTQAASADASEDLRSVSYEETVAAQAPTVDDVNQNDLNLVPQQTQFSHTATPNAPTPSSLRNPTLSAPAGGGPILLPDAGRTLGNLPLSNTALKDKDSRKRSIFGFKTRADETATTIQGTESRVNMPQPSSGRRTPQLRPVFGMALSEAAQTCPPEDIDICLPSPVYRCVEYLEAKSATDEEGIFRLSGSNVVIKALKDRFNTEGDVKLLAGEYYDVHAVASLLKLYLRELPTTVLTRDLHLDFLKTLELGDRGQKIAAVRTLVHKLPEANFELLATLSRFLITIVHNSDINKMTTRNVGIVFAPTLNIPAPLISLFLVEQDVIFSNESPNNLIPLGGVASPLHHQLIANPSNDASEAASETSAMDDIRSPRKQMFSNLPTPGPFQTDFGYSAHAMQGVTLFDQQRYDQRQSHDSESSVSTGFIPILQTHKLSNGISSPPRAEAGTAHYPMVAPSTHLLSSSPPLPPPAVSQPLQTDASISAGSMSNGHSGFSAMLNRHASTKSWHSSSSGTPSLHAPQSPAMSIFPTTATASLGNHKAPDERASTNETKKSRRESWMMGSGRSGKSAVDLQSTAGRAPGLEGKKKGSMYRLREIAGISGATVQHG